ncbi:type II toxin-antitoxin system VapC family toxin [Haloferula sp. BvORR071]|uniref:type II toxin-antitoxin system VapC family toxin n=1 Tax=Haloferula sp. BvORR071 TaxID=1396141 RepID=UPI00069871DF|nr:type II toxin-antitoxin system VapC family toxin [Haloferula sp. BvORR071]
MIYLDTSALIKLYLLEAGSQEVQTLLSSQNDPLPIWELHEMELTNALRLKVFWKELSEADADAQIDYFKRRKSSGLYYTPEISRSDLLDRYLRLTTHTAQLGCRTLDIQHVAAAVVLGANLFVSFDQRQRQLAGLAGLKVQAI